MTVAGGAAVLAEVGILGQTSTSPWARDAFFALLFPSFFSVLMFFQGMRSWGCSLTTILRTNIPTSVELGKAMKNTEKLFKKEKDWKVGQGDQLNDLDRYYACLVRKKYKKNPLAKWNWDGYYVPIAGIFFALNLLTLVIIHACMLWGF
jgi:hypothetical protein